MLIREICNLIKDNASLSQGIIYIGMSKAIVAYIHCRSDTGNMIIDTYDDYDNKKRIILDANKDVDIEFDGSFCFNHDYDMCQLTLVRQRFGNWGEV